MLSNMLDPFQINFKQLPVLMEFMKYVLKQILPKDPKDRDRDIVAIRWIGYAHIRGLDIEFIENDYSRDWIDDCVFVSYEKLEELWPDYAKSSSLVRKNLLDSQDGGRT